MMPLRSAAWAPVLAVFVLWGICGVSFNVAYQSEILRFAPRMRRRSPRPFTQASLTWESAAARRWAAR